MASISSRKNRDGTVSHRVMWRTDGNRQKSITFIDFASADAFKANVERLGPTEALAILDVIDDTKPTVTLRAWMIEHVDGLTGIQEGTRKKYRGFIARDYPELADLPVDAVSEASVGRWVARMEADGASGKTIQGKHAFLSGAMNAAMRKGLVTRNPCEGRRLPKTLRREMVFLSREDFELVHGRIAQERWADLAMWLVLTGMRFGEATALTVEDVDLDNATCRITKAWKHTGRSKRLLGPPKSARSVRTISLPPKAVDIIGRRIADETVKQYLFSNSAGTPATTQEFHNRAWVEARKVLAPRVPRVHDLRHTCASWLIGEGVPLFVVSRHLGHEDITTTANVYGHLDRASFDDAAAALARVMG